MFASSRSIRKAQGAKSRGFKHKHGKITRGRTYRIQQIKDEKGFIVKELFHYSPRKLKYIHQYADALAHYKAQEMVENGQVPVIGADAADEKAPETKS